MLNRSVLDRSIRTIGNARVGGQWPRTRRDDTATMRPVFWRRLARALVKCLSSSLDGTRWRAKSLRSWTTYLTLLHQHPRHSFHLDCAITSPSTRIERGKQPGNLDFPFDRSLLPSRPANWEVFTLNWRSLSYEGRHEDDLKLIASFVIPSSRDSSFEMVRAWTNAIWRISLHLFKLRCGTCM